jgi:hypothetical protein
VYRARKVQKFLSQPFQVAEIFTGKKGEFVPLADTIKGFRDIVNGKYDHFPEQAFYMVGNIDTVIAKAEEIAKEVARSKALRGETPADEDKKKGAKKGAVAAVKRDAKNPESMLPIPRPKTTCEQVRVLVKNLAEECQKEDLAYAQEIADRPVDPNDDDNLRVGWNFPKKEQINKEWAEWNTLYEQQTDLEGFFRSHFEEEVKLFKAAVEQEKREMSGQE